MTMSGMKRGKFDWRGFGRIMLGFTALLVGVVVLIEAMR